MAGTASSPHLDPTYYALSLVPSNRELLRGQEIIARLLATARWGGGHKVASSSTWEPNLSMTGMLARVGSFAELKVSTLLVLWLLGGGETRSYGTRIMYGSSR